MSNPPWSPESKLPDGFHWRERDRVVAFPSIGPDGSKTWIQHLDEVVQWILQLLRPARSFGL